MPKEKKAVSEATSAEEIVASDVSGPVAKVSKAKKTSFEVLNPNGVVVRTYSVEDHGEEAESLAKGYAEKIKGSVK